MAQRVAGCRILPAQVACFAGVRFGQIDVFFGRICGRKTLSAGIVKRADYLPLRDQAKLPGQVGLDAQFLQFLGNPLELIQIAGSRNRLLKNLDRRVGVPCGAQRGSLIDQTPHRIAAQLQARIVEHPRQPAVRGRGIHRDEQLEGQPSRARRMAPLAQEVFDRGNGQFAAGRKLALDDRVDGRAEPIGRQRAGIVERGQQGRQILGVKRGEFLPSFARRLMAGPFRSHLLEHAPRRPPARPILAWPTAARRPGRARKSVPCKFAQ